jgi:hypothetical protein
MELDQEAINRIENMKRLCLEYEDKIKEVVKIEDTLLYWAPRIYFAQQSGVDVLNMLDKMLPSIEETNMRSEKIRKDYANSRVCHSCGTTEILPNLSPSMCEKHWEELKNMAGL